MASTPHTQPFRFLDLPLELRCMIYEYLIPIKNEHHKIASTSCSVYPSNRDIVLQITSLPVALLRTCRTVHKELYPRIEKLIRECRPKILVDTRFRCNVKSLQMICLEARKHEANINNKKHLQEPYSTFKRLLRHSKVRAAVYSDRDWLETLSGKDCAMLTRFIQHVAWHLHLQNKANPGIEIGYRPTKVVARKTGNEFLLGFGASMMRLWISAQHNNEQRNVLTYPKLLLLRTDFGSEQCYRQAQSILQDAWQGSLVRTPTSYDPARGRWENESKIVEEDEYEREWGGF